jgi:AcrR family transcriptional regulator
MPSDTKDRWLQAGLEVLAGEGSPGLRIDRLAQRVGMSKGSFHHHFAGAEGYKRELLDHYEQLALAALEEVAATATPPQHQLRELTRRIGAADGGLYRPEVEVGIRAWALQDPQVRQVQARIDRSRLAALESLWTKLVDDPEQAHTAALLPYLVAVGATMVVPPLPASELQRVYELLLSLVPQVVSG